MEISPVEMCHGGAVEMVTEDFLISIVEGTSFDEAAVWESGWEIRCCVNIINSRRVG